WASVKPWPSAISARTLGESAARVLAKVSGTVVPSLLRYARVGAGLLLAQVGKGDLTDGHGPQLPPAAPAALRPAVQFEVAAGLQPGQKLGQGHGLLRPGGQVARRGGLHQQGRLAGPDRQDVADAEEVLADAGVGVPLLNDLAEPAVGTEALQGGAVGVIG